MLLGLIKVSLYTVLSGDSKFSNVLDSFEDRFLFLYHLLVMNIYFVLSTIVFKLT